MNASFQYFCLFPINLHIIASLKYSRKVLNYFLNQFLHFMLQFSYDEIKKMIVFFLMDKAYQNYKV